MRKTLCALLLSFVIVFQAVGQTNGPMDLVMLLDTSASMSDSYEETSAYLIGPFLREFLRIGDTFHLISFSGEPRLEISRRVEGVGDLETIIGRILLMYPLNRDSDVTGALNYAEKYAASLPSGRHHKVILISDGDGGSSAVQSAINEVSSRLGRQGADLQFIKIPLQGSQPSSGRPAVQPAAPPVQSAPAQAVPAPAPAAPASSQQQPAQQQPTQQQTAQTAPPAQSTPAQAVPAPAQSAPAQAAPTPAPAVPGSSQQQPAQQQPVQTVPQPQTTPPAAAAPVTQTPSQPDTSQVPGTQGTQSQETQSSQTTGETATQIQPAETEGPSSQTPPPSVSTGTEPAQPTARPAQPPQTQPAQAGNPDGIPFWLIILLGILALLILGLIIFFIARKLHDSPNRVMAQAASAPIRNSARLDEEQQNRIKDADMLSDYSKGQKSSAPPLAYPPPRSRPMPVDKPVDQNLNFDNGAPMLSLWVEDQNTAIGRRNIHTVKTGYNFTVGGGKSDFLIFLVPIPPHIAEVTFDGRQCIFVPKKPQYFPDIGSQQVPNCIGKTIKVISE
jgi:hypothetical protein